MPDGFTKDGLPVIGRKYTICQGDDVADHVVCVAKLAYRSGRVDVMWENSAGTARESLPWPIEAEQGTPSIVVWPGWREGE